MANNCLVTKLKGSVSADLPKLEECCIPIVNGNIILQGASIISVDRPLVLRGIGGVLLDGQETKEITEGGWTSPIIVSGLPDGTTVGEVRISGKYDLVTSVIAPMAGLTDLSTFKGMTINEFSFRGFDDVRATYMPIASLGQIAEAMPVLKVLSVGGGGANGDVTDLLPLVDTLTGLDGIGMGGSRRSNITGDFGDLGLLKKLNTINTFLVQTKISGSVNDFVTKRRSVTDNAAGSVQIGWLGDGGRVTYTGQATVAGNPVTYNNEPVQNWSTNVISWDAQGNITLTQSGNQ